MKFWRATCGGRGGGSLSPTVTSAGALESPTQNLGLRAALGASKGDVSCTGSPRIFGDGRKLYFALSRKPRFLIQHYCSHDAFVLGK